MVKSIKSSYTDHITHPTTVPRLPSLSKPDVLKKMSNISILISIGIQYLEYAAFFF